MVPAPARICCRVHPAPLKLLCDATLLWSGSCASQLGMRHVLAHAY